MKGQDHNLVRRTTRTCRSCGRTLDASEFASAEKTICIACWFSRDGENDGNESRRRRILAILAERVRIGQRLGNHKAVEYPNGIDLRLRNLLDDLRHYLIAVRIEIETDSEVVVHDGHLRRVGEIADEQFVTCWPWQLGFFANPDDREPRAALEEIDYARIVRISVIDRLVLGRAMSRVVWEASDAVAVCRRQRVTARSRERRLAAGLLLHAAIVLTVIIAGFIPFLISAVQHRVFNAIGWGILWWFTSVVVGSTLGAWDSFPRISALWREDQ